MENRFLEFCGFYMAHAVWSVSEGEILVPFAALESADGKRNLIRFVDNERYEDSAEKATQQVMSKIAEVRYGASFVDGYYTFESSERTDAIHMQARWNDGGEIRGMMLSLPYENPKVGGAFRVFRPKLRQFENIDGKAVQKNFNSFWDGADSHSEAVAVWNAALDQSK